MEMDERKLKERGARQDSDFSKPSMTSFPVLVNVLGYMARKIKVADGMKVANQLALQ